MKKSIITIAILGALSLASCGTKECRCYEQINSQWTGPYTTYASSSTRCAELNTRTLYCNEMNDPIIDPRDIAQDGKKAQKQPSE